jgi:hypothetical protein
MTTQRKYLLLAILLGSLSCKEEHGLARSKATSIEPAADTLARTSAVAALSTGSPSAPAPAPARMIVRDATLSLVVHDAAAALQRSTALAESRGGYVMEEKQWKEAEQVRASATLRVPAAQLRPVLAELARLAVRVEAETVTAEDVSQEFSDLGAQLKNLQATELELRQLLATVRQRTQKASEIMEVFTELTKVRGDIERIQGRMQYLMQTTALSKITLDLIPDALAAPVVEPGWQPVATARSAARTLVNSLKSLADVGIWVVLYLLPIGLIFVGVALAVRALWLWARRRRASASSQ